MTMSTCWRETTSLCASEMPTTTRYLSVCLFNCLSLCLSVCLSDPTFCLVELAGSSEGDEEAGQRSVALSLPPGGGFDPDWSILVADPDPVKKVECVN